MGGRALLGRKSEIQYTHVHTLVHTLNQQSNVSTVQKCDAIIRGTECSDYALFLSSAHSFFLSSLFQYAYLSLFSLFSSLTFKRFLLLTRHCRCVGEKHNREISLDGGNAEHTHARRHAQKHSNSPRQWAGLSRIRRQKKEASEETVKQKAGGSTFISPLQPFTFQILSVVSPPLVSCRFFLVSDPLRRIAAVKLLTSSSTSVMTLHSAAKLSLSTCVCVCGCQSEFLTSSSG